MTSAIELIPTKPLLAVGCIARGALADEAAEVLGQSAAGCKTADTEREEDPATGVGGLGGVLRQLLADLAVDLVSAGRRWGKGRGFVSLKPYNELSHVVYARGADLSSGRRMP